MAPVDLRPFEGIQIDPLPVVETADAYKAWMQAARDG
jgi:hypothetical protein